MDIDVDPDGNIDRGLNHLSVPQAAIACLQGQTRRVFPDRTGAE